MYVISESLYLGPGKIGISTMFWHFSLLKTVIFLNFPSPSEPKRNVMLHLQNKKRFSFSSKTGRNSKCNALSWILLRWTCVSGEQDCLLVLEHFLFLPHLSPHESYLWQLWLRRQSGLFTNQKVGGSIRWSSGCTFKYPQARCWTTNCSWWLSVCEWPSGWAWKHHGFAKLLDSLCHQCIHECVNMGVWQVGFEKSVE